MGEHVGRALIIFGGLLVVAGLVMVFADRIPFLGKLPGDISFKKGNVSFYFPVITCLILSILLTVIVNLFRK